MLVEGALHTELSLKKLLALPKRLKIPGLVHQNKQRNMARRTIIYFLNKGRISWQETFA
jgi:hypothetical protein